MPELPEVETVKETLKQAVTGLYIRDVTILYDKMMTNETKQMLINQQITGFDRKGKYLIFNLTDYDLISHLRMEGKYFVKQDEPILKHEHILFHLSDGTTLRYHDTRKFGTFDLRKKRDTFQTKPLSLVADEPFDIDILELYRKLKKSNRPIKSILLDQTIISGIGNIYADEILYATHLHPLKPSKTITKLQTERLKERAIGILSDAIDAGGTTIRSYQSSLGITGRFQLTLMVHQRENEQCYICGDFIKRIKVGGRSSFYCASCQTR